MSNSTSLVDTISSSQSQKEVTANAAFDALSQSMIFGRRASTTSLLSWGYYGGRFTKADTTNIAIANGVLTLTAAATNYVEVNSVGVVSSNTVSFTAGRTNLYTVVVGATTVTSYTDHRDGSQGNFLASASSVGTVTASGGALTSNAVVLGAGATDTKVVAGVSTDGVSKLLLGVAGTSVGAVEFNNATSGSITVAPATGALGTIALTLPATTGTIALLSNITGTNSGTNTGDETVTTMGSLINGATDKATPVDADYLGLMDSAASNVLKKLSWANLKASLAAIFQPVDSDLTTIAGLTATTDNFIQSKSSAWASRTIAQVTSDLQGTGLIADAVGFRNIPQNSQSAAYTTVASDSGKHILHPSADTTARIFTIDSNANVAYPIGTAITFVNQNAAGVVTIAITSDTMRLSGAGTTGSRTLAANGIATALKLTSTEWIISGSGLT